MRDECRNCRFWHPLEDWERDPDCEGYAHCGYSPAVDWPVDDMGRHEPPFTQAGYWCQYWERFLSGEQEGDVWRCLEALADRLLAIEKLNQPGCSVASVPDVAGLVKGVGIAIGETPLDRDISYTAEARAAINAVAGWLKSEGYWAAHDRLRRELGK